MSNGSRILSKAAGLIVLALLVASPVFSQSAVPSLGKGGNEIYIFADYFCPPCKRTDAKAETLMKTLLATGDVKVTFVDVPFNRLTPMFAKYYLYAANAGGGAKNIFKVRKALFEAAQEKKILTEDALVAHLQAKHIDLKPMDEKSVFLQMSGMIRDAKIEKTPMFLLRQPLLGERKYVGEVEIIKGLEELAQTLKKGKK